jgi:hypothetical protein
MWQVEQPTSLKKIFLPLTGSPGTVMFLGGASDGK